MRGRRMTRAEERLNSNHGRLVHAARAVPERLRSVPIPGWGWTPRDMLAHVVAWQEEAVRHLDDPEAPWPARSEVDEWNAALIASRDSGEQTKPSFPKKRQQTDAEAAA